MLCSLERCVCGVVLRVGDHAQASQLLCALHSVSQMQHLGASAATQHKNIRINTSTAFTAPQPAGRFLVDRVACDCACARAPSVDLYIQLHLKDTVAITPAGCRQPRSLLMRCTSESSSTMHKQTKQVSTYCGRCIASYRYA